MEWTTPSRPSTCSPTCFGGRSRCAWSVTSSSMTGVGCGSRETIRRVIPNARPKFDTRTVAPCSCATRATAKPKELSIVTPATRIRLPSRMPMSDVLLRVGAAGWFRQARPTRVAGPEPASVAHAEAAVDRDDGPGDVSRGVRPQPGHHRGDLLDGGVAPERDLRLVLRLLLGREYGGHLRLHEPGRDHVRGDRP